MIHYIVFILSLSEKVINYDRINNKEKLLKATGDEDVSFDSSQLSQALLDFNLIPVPLVTYMADNTIVINANKAPNDKLMNMEIMIIAIIAPMNAATVFIFYSLLATTEYTLFVSIVLRIEFKCMCKLLPLVCDDQNINYVKS